MSELDDKIKAFEERTARRIQEDMDEAARKHKIAALEAELRQAKLTEDYLKRTGRERMKP